MTSKESIRVFNEEYLITLLKRDNATLLGSYEKLNGGVKIKYKCQCSEESNKLFRDIAYYGGAFCKKCNIKNKAQKIRDTCKKVYGVTNVSQVEKFQKKKEETYMEHFGMHPKKTKEVQEKYKQTCLTRYGVENSAQDTQIKEKIKDTFQEKYGGHPMLNSTIKEKVKNTCFEKYGGYPAENDMVKDKIKSVFINKYGSYPTQNKEIKNKIYLHNIEKYGCHPSQTTEVMEKIQNTSKKYKTYTMPSGAVRLIQGYEPFAMKQLLEIYTEDQIISERKNIPRFPYTIENKQKYYFPDIYIPHMNTIIEVKSSWTYEKDKQKLDCVKENIKSLGYIFEIWIYTRDGKCEKIL